MIPFKRVYRMKVDGDDSWEVVMGVTPYPDNSGLWMLRASTTKPSTDVLGRVFEGAEGKLVVIGDRFRTVLEPLTLGRFEGMRADIGQFDYLRGMVSTDEALQAWYWDEFGTDGDGDEIEQADILTWLHAKFQPGPI